MKKGTDTDLKIKCTDDTTLKWLSSLLGCTADQALTVLVSAAGKKRGAESANK